MWSNAGKQGYRRRSQLAGKAQGFVVPVILFSRLLVHAVKQICHSVLLDKICGMALLLTFCVGRVF